jgi:hypothetical protein
VGDYGAFPTFFESLHWLQLDRMNRYSSISDQAKGNTLIDQCLNDFDLNCHIFHEVFGNYEEYPIEMSIISITLQNLRSFRKLQIISFWYW